MSKYSLTSVPRAAVASYVLAALVFGGSSIARASEVRATKDFADIAVAVNRYVGEFGAKHVLLALDIDNTLMSMDDDLGSDHWFEWQRYLLENEPNSNFLVANTFDGLLDVQGILYQQGRMHPPQSDLPRIISQLQALGISTIILTSRGPEFRVPTERELKRCKYDGGSAALPVRNVPTGTYLAYDPAKPERQGLTAKEIELFDLQSPRPVSYENGLFMTAGQHKGIMLLTLLHDSPLEVKAIVYADDNVRHVGNVFSAAVDRNLEISSFHYQREDVRVQRFQYSNKCDVYCRWRKLSRDLAVVCK